LVERRRVLAVDVDLGEQRKGDAIVDLAKRLDLLFAARFLLTELVAGEAQNLESLAVQLLIKRFETSYCGVKPHLLAVLTMSSTLPL
jgi:hypothetical protein